MKVGKVDEHGRLGRRAPTAASSARTARRSAGSFSRTSVMPTTERASGRTTGSRPASTSRAPPIPNARSRAAAPRAPGGGARHEDRRRPRRRRGRRFMRPRAGSRGPRAEREEARYGSRLPLTARRLTRETDTSATRRRVRRARARRREARRASSAPGAPGATAGRRSRDEQRVERHDQEVVGRHDRDHRFFPGARSWASSTAAGSSGRPSGGTRSRTRTSARGSSRRDSRDARAPRG